MKKTPSIRRSFHSTTLIFQDVVLLDLAPFRFASAVAGLHWAIPSATLDKNIQLICFYPTTKL
jgi:hypothetical protein